MKFYHPWLALDFHHCRIRLNQITRKAISSCSSSETSSTVLLFLHIDLKCPFSEQLSHTASLAGHCILPRGGVSLGSSCGGATQGVQRIEWSIHVNYGTRTLAATSKVSLKDDAYIEDSQEGQSECADLLYRTAVVLVVTSK